MNIKNILHPIKSLEKWALGRLLKRVTEQLPLAKDYAAKLWEENKDEIMEKVTQAVKKTIADVIAKALQKQGIKVPDISQN